MSVAIKVENLSKIYRLGELGTGTLSRDLQRWVAKISGKEDPYLKIGEINERAVKGGDIVYSLKDINLEINHGDAVGIIGRNGAGKSTLLKILSRITSPTTGKIHLRGRVASLLEVGTGFHPELTGKENIYLNGAILGMRKKEIDRNLEEIINFSGVERYIDTPVKRYSSGMYVRLAFAIAAHLESEILIVDEVLSVGDAEFQKKCLGKMEQVSRGDGRTILFVSHHMPSIKALCNKGIVLKNGGVDFQGEIVDSITRYFETAIKVDSLGKIPDNIARHNTGEAKFRGILLSDSSNQAVDEIYLKESLNFTLDLEVYEELKDVLVDIQISSLDGVVITYSMNVLDGAGSFSFDVGQHQISVCLNNDFQPGNYTVSIGIHKSSYGTPTIDYVENVYNFAVSRLSRNQNVTDYNFNFVYGYIRPQSVWTINS